MLAASVAAGCGDSAKTLKVGQPATVSYTDEKATVELTPLSIEKKSASDMANIELEPSQKGSTPYFVKVRYKNVGAGPIKRSVSGSVYTLSALDDRDENQSSLSFFGDFASCSDRDIPDLLEKGKAFDTCYVYLIPEGGGALDHLEWVDVSAGSEDRNPVHWKP